MVELVLVFLEGDLVVELVSVLLEEGLLVAEQVL